MVYVLVNHRRGPFAGWPPVLPGVLIALLVCGCGGARRNLLRGQGTAMTLQEAVEVDVPPLIEPFPACEAADAPIARQLSPPTPPTETAAVPDYITKLMELRGDDYVALRTTVVNRPESREELTKLSREAKDWQVGLLSEALLYRMRNPDTAKLLDANHVPPGVRWRFHGGGRRNPRSLGGYDGSHILGLLSCFGRETFPILAEHLTYIEDWTSTGTVDALVQMRDPRVVDLLTWMAKEHGRGIWMRVSGVWGLEQCLVGLPAKRYGATRTPFFPPPSLQRVDHLFGAKDFPALELVGEKRTSVMNELAALVQKDKDAQVRAMAARALMQGDSSVVTPLAKAMRTDTERWVRAWCAAALRRIGGEEAAKALAQAEATEKDGQVLAVIRGKRMPVTPEQGIPKKTIFAKYDHPDYGSYGLPDPSSTPRNRILPGRKGL